MAYSFKPSDRSVRDGVIRIARDQIDTGIAETADDALSPADRIHQARKRCKKLRGLIRLVRPAFPDYAAENAAFRDAARRLSDIRDAAALVEICDALKDHFGDQLAERAFAGIRGHFAARARQLETGPEAAAGLSRLRADLEDARSRTAGWALTEDGAAAVTGGLAKTYRRARKAMAAAREDPTGQTLHAWRKRVKYHWYHLRLLKSVSPVIAAAVDEADRLSDLLGTHHDLHVMESALDDAGEIADAAALEAFRGLLHARRARLETAAFDRGRALFREPPDGLAARVGGYWEAWAAHA